MKSHTLDQVNMITVIMKISSLNLTYPHTAGNTTIEKI